MNKRLPLLLFALLLSLNSVFAQSSEGLVAHWRFDDNTSDSSGNGHNGTAFNISYAAGRNATTKKAAVFNGNSSYISVPYSTGLNLDSYSICAIVKLDDFYSDLCQISTIMQRGTSHSNGNYTLSVLDTIANCSTPADTNAEVVVAEAGPFNINVPMSEWQYPYPVHTGNWYSIVATFNRAEIRIYVNGQLRNIATSGSGTLPLGSSNDGIFIGAAYQSVSGSYPYWFNGLMDDLRIYNRVLSENEISSYNSLATENIKEQAFNVDVFPNPNNGSFTVKGRVNSKEPVSATVVNVLGQSVYSEKIPLSSGDFSREISLPNVTTGMHYLKLQASDATVSQPILIK